MTDNVRDVRDILAECMRRERLGLIRPLWADWWDEAREPIRRRADHLIRMLGEYGVELVHKGASLPPAPPPASRVIWRAKLIDREAERLIRRDAAGWAIVTIEAGKETIEQTFTLEEASVNGGAILTDDPAARKIPGLGRQQAAAQEIFRVDAVAMEPPQ